MCDLSYLLVKFILHFDKGSRLMNKQMTDHNDWTARTVRNTIRLGFWTGAWLVTMAVAVFGPKFIWDFNTVPTIFAAPNPLARSASKGTLLPTVCFPT